MMEFIILLSNLLFVFCQNHSRAPVIGVLTQDSYDPTEFPMNEYVSVTNSYVRWIESAGAKVVPIFHTSTPEEIKSLLYKLNGVLIQGGGMDLHIGKNATKFQLVTESILNEAAIMNGKGDYFPVWGTCLGFQSMAIWVSNNPEILGNVTDSNRSHTITLENTTSRLWDSITNEQKDYVQNKPAFFFQHHFMVTLDSYFSSENFLKTFTVTSNSEDINGKKFISSFEGRNIPFYATQFHPEKNSHEWNYGYDYNHERMAVRTSQNMANFFIDEAFKNQHSFNSYQEEDQYWIFNFPTDRGTMGQTEEYFIPINNVSNRNKTEIEKRNLWEYVSI